MRKKILISFVFIFTLFTVGILVFEYSREKQYKTDALSEKLDAYAEVANALWQKHASLEGSDYLFPPHFRLTLIDLNGKVLFDNVIAESTDMENHADRPEIQQARKHRTGSDIRTSLSTNQEYIYYAKRFGNHFVRVALPYNVQVQNLLKPDNFFLYYIIALFVIVLLIINYTSSRFGKSIEALRDFSITGEHGGNFPEDELGEIGKKIAENYTQLSENKKRLNFEREKLLQHVHSSEEGICFFAADRSVEFYNGLFIQSLNTIIDEAQSNPAVIFANPEFDRVNEFLNNHREESYFETKIEKQAKTFALRINRFETGGFEMIINDISNSEKTRILKQEMTGNIAHELRTPVAGIRACLETVLNSDLDEEQSRNFTQKAYNQSLVLSELIQDLSLLSKIEGAAQSFRVEAVNISTLLAELKHEVEPLLREKTMTMDWKLPENLTIQGNHNLLFSIFRNLTDNAIRYAGSHTAVHIQLYNEDVDYYYVSFSDTGVGIPEEQHLNRLFERFYRTSEGRTRETGGSGLGLSIVKNAVHFHKGKIVAKNRATGGLEFLFTLKKGR
ncbi:MAG: two-component sensor histidine kinase [Bacteroidales bacterium]|jgi:signal transduction histidine kinase|nr:two-component sensor histidine kinase [Bacteroidales bacterium]